MSTKRFDPRDLLFKSPFGAVPCGADVSFCFRPERGAAVTRCELLAHGEFADQWTTVELTPAQEDGHVVYRGIFTAPDDVELVWYHFRLSWADGGTSCYGKNGLCAWDAVEPWQLTVYDDTHKAPAWFGRGVTYQIFPDRFRRAKSRDVAGLVGPRTLHENWDELPEYRPNAEGEITCSDFFGGDLQGITEKLDYLASLGVTTLYLCPIFEASTNHRYDTACYERIDPLLGDEADFRTLCAEAKKRGIYVMLDGVFNHTGRKSVYFNADGFYDDLGAAQGEQSPYYRWYNFHPFPDEYDAWWGIKNLPAVNELEKSYVDYIIEGDNSIIKHWLRAGASGWRLDVADELPDDLRAAVADWQAARTVRSQSPLLDYADLLEFFLFHLRARQGEDIRPDLEHSLLPPACRALLAAAVTERHHPAQTPAPSPTTSAGPDTTPEHHEAPHKGHAVPRQMSLLGMVAATAAPAPVPAPSRRASALPWRHVLVDEVQDLSPVQLRLIRALLPEDGNGFFGIGDPDQAIYGFRGASGQSEDSLRALWPSLRVCRLGQSYRASQGVLDMAQSLLQGRGHCGALQAMRREQARLHLFSAPDQQAEARWIAGRIRQLLGATAHTLMDQIAQEDELAGTLSPGDVAVLVRLKAQIPVIRRALEQEGIPCAAPAQEDCWQDPLCAAVLRLAIARGQGEAPVPVSDDAESDDLLPLLEQALDLAPDAPLPDPQALQARLSGHSRLPAPLWQGTAWKQLCRAWQDCGQWEALVQQLGLQHEAELIRARSEQVQILTLHASKGLEFQAVFLPGLEEGLLPMRRDLLLENPDDDMSPAAQAARLEEERRLFYVGLTRAARALYVSHSAGRRLFGRELALEPSSFLPLVRDFCRQSTLARHTKAVREHLSLF